MQNFQPNVRKLAPLGAALLLSAFGATAAMAQDAPAPMTTPAMVNPLTANPNPFYFDTSDWLGDAGGKIYITGQLSELAYYQSSPVHNGIGDASTNIDLSNAQVEIQKTDGWLQFYVQAGSYSFPTIGIPYVKSSIATALSFGNVPVAYVKLQGQGDLGNFSLEGGKLPTLVGDEYNFTFENMNIERGLLWNTEQAFTRGIQANYASGPLSLSLSWNDGLYSKKLNWLTGLASYAIAPTDTLALSGGGNLGGGTPSNPLNDGSVLDLIWTHTDGAWVISPYLQWTQTPTGPYGKSTQDWAGAILASVALDDNAGSSGCAANMKPPPAACRADKPMCMVMAPAAVPGRSPSPRPISGNLPLSARTSAMSASAMLRRASSSVPPGIPRISSA